MVNPLNLFPWWRDTWGSFDPVALAQLAPLANDDCYQPHYAKAPDDDGEVLAPGENRKYGLQIIPGSIIWGVYHRPAAGSFDVPGFAFTVRDLSLQFDIWDVPTPDIFVCNNQPGAYPWLLTSPYPVVGTGSFDVQIWNNSDSDLRCQLVFGVCQVVRCKY